jgi:hypothetical protein
LFFSTELVFAILVSFASAFENVAVLTAGTGN